VTRSRKIAVAAVVFLAALQLVPIERTNPPVETTVAAPPEVLALLRRACFDCHSHETVWAAPQSYLAPASWLVARDVGEGRRKLNFSRWSAVDAKERRELAREIPEVLDEGEMPPCFYRIAHPEARLGDAERAALSAWARTLADGGRAP
jgi:hypothetical protein